MKRGRLAAVVVLWSGVIAWPRFSNRPTIQWAGQWPLNAWPNNAFTAVWLAFGFYRGAIAGYSPVGAFSARADRVFVEAVQSRWRGWQRAK